MLSGRLGLEFDEFIHPASPDEFGPNIIEFMKIGACSRIFGDAVRKYNHHACRIKEELPKTGDDGLPVGNIEFRTQTLIPS